jgi:hypothetical protein
MMQYCILTPLSRTSPHNQMLEASYPTCNTIQFNAKLETQKTKGNKTVNHLVQASATSKVLTAIAAMIITEVASVRSKIRKQ